MPGGEEAPERRLLGGLDLAPQHRERGAPDSAEDVGLAPLALGAAGAELAADELVRALERHELGVDARLVEGEARRDLGRGERPVRPCVPTQERPQRLLDRVEEDLRDAAGRRQAEGVANESRVLDRCEQLEVTEAEREWRAARAGASPRTRGRTRRRTSGPARRRRSWSSSTFRGIGRSDDSTCSIAPRSRSSRSSSTPMQLAEQVAVERERLRAPLLGRRVVLVHVRRDVVEEERRGERRRRRRLDLGDVESTRADPGRTRWSAGRSKTSCRHSRYDSSTIGNCGYRRATWSRLCAFSRCCQSGVRWPGRRRGIRSARAAFSRKRAPYSADWASSDEQEVLELVGLEDAGRRAAAARLRPGSGARFRRPTTATGRRGPSESRSRAPQRHRPRRVHAPAERREDADAPVADLVAEALDHDRPVGGDDARSRPPARGGT